MEKNEKAKMPELKVQSFVTSLDEDRLTQIVGGGTDSDGSDICCPGSLVWSCTNNCATATACSTTDRYGQTHCGC